MSETFLEDPKLYLKPFRTSGNLRSASDPLKSRPTDRYYSELQPGQRLDLYSASSDSYRRTFRGKFDRNLSTTEEQLEVTTYRHFTGSSASLHSSESSLNINIGVLGQTDNGKVDQKDLKDFFRRFDQKLTKEIEKVTEILGHVMTEVKNLNQRVEKIETKVSDIEEKVEKNHETCSNDFENIDLIIEQLIYSIKDHSNPLSDDQINIIAKKIGPRIYRKVFRRLRMSDTEIEWVEERNGKGDIVVDLLKTWRQKDGSKATLTAFIKATIDAEERDVAKEVLKKIKSSE